MKQANACIYISDCEREILHAFTFTAIGFEIIYRALNSRDEICRQTYESSDI